MRPDILRRPARLAIFILAITLLAAKLADVKPLQSIEHTVYDRVLAWHSPASAAPVLIVALEQASKQHPTRPTQVLARAVAQLSAAGARAIVLLPAGEGWKADAAGIQELADAMRNAGNVYLPLPAAGRDQLPADLVLASAGIGHMQVITDADGIVRSLPAFTADGAHLYPALPLLLAGQAQQPTAEDAGGHAEIILSGNERMHIRPILRAGGQAPLALNLILNGSVAAEVVAGRMVLVAGPALARSIYTPLGPMEPAQFLSRATASIISGDIVERPPWANAFEALLLFSLMLIFLLVWERLPGRRRIVLAVVACLLFPVTAVLMLAVFDIWLQWAAVALLSLVSFLVLAAEERWLPAAVPSQGNIAKMQALSFHSQGMLDKAFESFRCCPVDDDVLDGLYKLALEFERQRRFDKAADVYAYLSALHPDYRDVPSRLARCHRPATGAFAMSGNSRPDTLLITGGARPILGRYEIIRELGKGAMGKVYLGMDPTIHRQVAIKTLALAREFDADELEEVKARFFREAETAGRLNHPNIVTIYDAGEDRDLAYIAMELLHGTDLTPFTKAGRLLQPVAALKIAGKVAEALHFAHAHGVVHRDIKPANVMLLRNKTVKVMDFGIARITASTRTKTGIVLGTPSYMSPEQLSGRHVDGRSDLFSLGVMLYEMLCGVRPFRASSMASLMFRITNDAPEDVRQHRRDLPASASRLFERALAKDADDRFASGKDMAMAIVACLHDVRTRVAA